MGNSIALSDQSINNIPSDLTKKLGFHRKKENLSYLSAKQRAIAAIIGGFVADAATMPLHYIYDQSLLENLYKSLKKPIIRQRTDSSDLTSTEEDIIEEDSTTTLNQSNCLGLEFYKINQNPFYQYDIGLFSPYADEVLPLLKVLSEKGYFDIQAIADGMYIFYSSYQGPLNEPSKIFMSSYKKGLPITAYNNENDLIFMALMKVPIIVARYAGSLQMLDHLDEAISLHQTNEKVKNAAYLVAKLLEKVILGSSIKDALLWACKSDNITIQERDFLYYLFPNVETYNSVSISIPMKKNLSLSSLGSDSAKSSPRLPMEKSLPMKDLSEDSSDGPKTRVHRQRNSGQSKVLYVKYSGNSNNTVFAPQIPYSIAVEQLGMSGELPGAILTGLYGLICFTNYEKAIRSNILAGGDNIPRAWLLGVLLAAEGGLDAIPNEWKEKTKLYSTVLHMSERLVGSNTYFDALREKSWCSFAGI
eukprot:gene19563-25463_t